MSKPNVFISSTCYDLLIVRNELHEFLEGRGFIVINSEKSTFGVKPKMHSHSASLEQVNSADYLLLIIGKRRGGTFIASEKSITNEEYNRAIQIGLPIIIFIDKAVRDAIPYYKKNPSSDLSHVVDDTRIFDFVEYINASAYDNWMFTFESIQDIKTTLQSQFAYYLKLFSENIKAKHDKTKSKELNNEEVASFPPNFDFLKTLKYDQSEITFLINGLRELYNIMTDILKSQTQKDTKLEKLKCLWVIARHGELQEDRIYIEINTFKQFAWSTYRGKRVFLTNEIFQN